MSRNKTDKNHTMRGRCRRRSRADEVATPQPTWGLGLTGIAHAPREKKNCMYIIGFTRVGQIQQTGWGDQRIRKQRR